VWRLPDLGGGGCSRCFKQPLVAGAFSPVKLRVIGV
jgi:hypothetical protein